MSRFWRSNATSTGVSRAQFRIVAAIVALLGAVSGANAAVIVTGDPAAGFQGVGNVAPSVFTIDPYNAPVTAEAERGIATDRRLRQTFKNPASFNVGEIVVSFDTTGAPEVGLGIRIYEVDNVLDGTWNPGTLIKEIAYTSTLPASDQTMSFQLTGGDVFALPARFSGTTGYGIEISTPFAQPGDGNPGLLHFSNDGTDHYADGRYYTEGGGASTASRDVGVSLIASTEVPCDPGDVNCADGVDLVDLGIIADHFRQNGAREDGDLTGDGFIDFDDFDEWKRHYPLAFSGAAATAFFARISGAVPEPASGILLLCGSAGSVLLCRSRRPKGPWSNQMELRQ